MAGAVSAAGNGPLLDQVRLACVPGIGARMRQQLLERFGTPADVFAASTAELRTVPGVGPALAAAIVRQATATTAAELLDLCRRRDVSIHLVGEEGYPPLLQQITDPPGLLFVRGRLEPRDALAVAIVGSRHATAYGRKQAWQLAGGLARAGYTVVSGLARGIDAAAHKGALEAGGRTLAVLGSGVLNVYPPEHAELAQEIEARGAILSESPPLTEPFPGCFPRRNRIVSGLALGTVVVQASDRSGALITARLAGEQGREVFAVPGPVDCRLSRGGHRLIRDGAKLVEGVDDVLEELGPLFETATSATGQTVRSPAELQLGEIEHRVLAAVDDQLTDGSSADIDTLVAVLDLDASRVLATIGVLEMRRIIRRLPGNRVARC